MRKTPHVRWCGRAGGRNPASPTQSPLMRLRPGDCAHHRLSEQTRRRVGRVGDALRWPHSEPGFFIRPTFSRGRPGLSVPPAQSIAFEAPRRSRHPTQRASNGADTLPANRRHAGGELATAHAPGKFGEPSPRPNGLEPPRWRSPALSRRAAWVGGGKGFLSSRGMLGGCRPPALHERAAAMMIRARRRKRCARSLS